MKRRSIRTYGLLRLQPIGTQDLRRDPSFKRHAHSPPIAAQGENTTTDAFRCIATAAAEADSMHHAPSVGRLVMQQSASSDGHAKADG